MKIKKTVGMTYTAKEHMAGERKSYCIITECGEEIECLAAGTQGFTCNGVKYKSLKAIKNMIEAKDLYSLLRNKMNAQEQLDVLNLEQNDED